MEMFAAERGPMYASTRRQQFLTSEARHVVREGAACTAALVSAKALLSAALQATPASLYHTLGQKSLPHLQAVDPGEAEALQLAREAATRAAALAAVETLLWGSRAPYAKQARPTLGQRLARAVTGALLAGFAVKLEDVAVTLAGANPADRVTGAGQPGQPPVVQITGEGSEGAAGGVALRVRGLTLQGSSQNPIRAFDRGRGAQFIARLSLQGLCLDAAALPCLDGRLDPGRPVHGSSAPPAPSYSGRTSIVRQWSLAAQLTWSGAGGCPKGLSTGIRGAFPRSPAPWQGQHPVPACGPSSVGPELALEVRANALRVGGEAAALAAAAAALASLASFQRFRACRSMRPQVRAACCLLPKQASQECTWPPVGRCLPEKPAQRAGALHGMHSPVGQPCFLPIWCEKGMHLYPETAGCAA